LIGGHFQIKRNVIKPVIKRVKHGYYIIITNFL